MANFFIGSDPHFGHELLAKVRGFKSTEEMNELIVQNHNKIVKPGDHFYMLGDVAMKKQHLSIIKRLNGRKRLVMGNHDIFEAGEYFFAGFQKVMGFRMIDGFALTHIPIHPNSLKRFGVNIHGHLHENRVKLPSGEDDPRYFSACYEKIGYHPAALEDIKKHFEKNRWKQSPDLYQ